MADTNPRTIHGIDLTAPGGVEALLSFHRAQFGDAVMMATEGGAGGEGEGEGSGEGETQGQQGQGAASGTNEGQEPQEPTGGENGQENGAQRGEPGQATPPAETDEDRQAREARLVQEAEERVTSRLVEALTGKKAGEDKAPTVEDLQAAAQQEREAAAQARAELAVYRSAAAHGADPNRLTDSRAFINALNGIDVTDAAAVDKLIREHVQKNPHLKAAGAPGRRSGADHAGGQPVPAKPAKLGDAIAGAYRAG